MKSLKSIYRVICLLLLLGHFVPAEAQNNPYKIDDSLFPIYQRATKFRTRPEGVLMADTLYEKAVKLNDKKAQCLALTIPVIYSLNSRASYEDL